MTAIIAGTGILPIHACRALLQDNKKFFIISLFPEDNFDAIKRAIPESIEIIQKPFYKTKAILETLEEKKTAHVLFIGKVDKQNLLKRFKLDWLAVKLLATLTTKSDFSIMNKIESELEKRNISLLKQDKVLKGLLVNQGVLTGNLTPELEESIHFGLTTARKISTLDIGQTVIVKDKMILAIEAIEGTNKCIQRGITLGEKDIVICKAANIHHNTKFDLPTIGSDTIKDVKRGEIKAIAWQADTTLIADKELFVKRAEELEITLVAV